MRELFVMFHIEDVFDTTGQPAILSSSVSMNNIIDNYCDLTARPICQETEPEHILDLQQKLSQDRVTNQLPILQAVYVCLKASPDADCNISHVPKPTAFRNKPGNFSMGTTSFYLNPMLKLQLNIKLVKFFGHLGTQPPFPTKIKTVPSEQDELKLLEQIKKLDENDVQRFLYGDFPHTMEQLPQEVTNTLPKLIDKIPIKLVYLHRTKFNSESGIVEICLSPSRSNKLKDPVSVLAYFKLSKYRFFMKKDCFAADLANIMPVHSTENYFANIELAFPGSLVPYVVLDIWNENLRQDVGAHVPISDSINHDREFIDDCANSIAVFTNMSVEILLRSNKRETMNRERSKDTRREEGDSFRPTDKRKEDYRNQEDKRHKREDERRSRDDEKRPREDERRQREARKEDNFDDFNQEDRQRSSRRDPRNDRQNNPQSSSRSSINSSNYNPKSLDHKKLANAKYFIMKSFNVEDILVSIHQGVWSSTDQINRKLNHQYREAK